MNLSQKDRCLRIAIHNREVEDRIVSQIAHSDCMRHHQPRAMKFPYRLLALIPSTKRIPNTNPRHYLNATILQPNLRPLRQRLPTRSSRLEHLRSPSQPKHLQTRRLRIPPTNHFAQQCDLMVLSAGFDYSCSIDSGWVAEWR